MGSARFGALEGLYEMCIYHGFREFWCAWKATKVTFDVGSARSGTLARPRSALLLLVPLVLGLFDTQIKGNMENPRASMGILTGSLCSTYE